MYINYDSATGNLLKIYLTKEERSLLNFAINLPPYLKPLVRDQYIYVDKLNYRSHMIDESGYPIDISDPNNIRRVPISWITSPYKCKNFLNESEDNRLLLIYRRPALRPKMPYDFERVLIRTSVYNKEKKDTNFPFLDREIPKS